MDTKCKTYTSVMTDTGFFLCINCWTVLHHRWPHFETTYSLKPEFMKITICNHDQHFNSNFLFLLKKKGGGIMKQASVWRFKILIQKNHWNNTYSGKCGNFQIQIIAVSYKKFYVLSRNIKFFHTTIFFCLRNCLKVG